ncbi:MAG: hypothetical protein WC876_06350 [Candidatus Thermoplasmatota archaeon]|jgi:hypothetical protein
MQTNKIAPIVVALLFFGTSIVAASQDTVSTVPLPTTAVRPTFLGDLADKVAPGLRSELVNIEPLLSSAEVASAAELLDQVDLVHGAYADATTAREALAANAALAGLPLTGQAAAAPSSALGEILQMYRLSGVTPSALDVSELQSSLTSLTASQSEGLAILVSSVNQALVLQASGGSAYEAAAGMLDAADAVESLLAPQASTSSACTVFEDPQQLIWIGSPCDDVVAAQPARMLQYDPGGDDIYYSNAGGAGGVPALGAGLIVAGVQSDRQLLEILDNLTLGGIFPVDPTNETWQNSTVDNFPDNVLGTVNNVTGSIGPMVGFIPEFIAGYHVILETHPELLRTDVPVALAIDVEGNDIYDSDRNFVQGAAADQDLGVLLDRAGTDSYTCMRNCQGYGIHGLGLLIDEEGNDAYDALSNAQGSGDPGVLIELAGDDTYTGQLASVQGSTYTTALPRQAPTVLFDRSGNDLYTAFGPLSQGAGALLIDLSGDDVYDQTGSPQGMAQGVGVTATPGMLVDASGSDQYLAQKDAQGVGFGGPGVLADFGGDDVYQSTNSGQGFARSAGSLGLLYDSRGDDTYSAASGQGAADTLGVGVLADADGDDSYTLTGSGQGASLGSPGGLLGLLLDGAGSDLYVAGEASQGSGSSGQGAGLLADLKGIDSYTAGAYSQGSGGANGGVGILLDGLQEHTEFGPLTVIAQVNPEVPSQDAYTAGNWSQGSSGPVGGVGLLLEREHNSGLRNTFVAGEHSQGAASAQGVGILANNNGKDDYTAGAYSQGASSGGLGLLVDQLGNDRYFPSDVATSHGYGESRFDSASPAVAIGVLLDDGGHDNHPGMANNECLSKGDIGLAMDTDAAQVPSDCAGDALAAIVQFVMEAAPEIQALIVNTINGILFPAAPPTPPGTIYFYDGMEDTAASATKWTNTTDSDVTCLGLGDPEPVQSEWRIRNQTSEPQASPNAHSGAHYWYAGRHIGTGYTSCVTAVLTTSTISLTGSTAPALTYWYAGSSESCCDTLTVKLLDLTASTSTTLATYAGDPVNDIDPALAAPTYLQETFDLSAYNGHDIQVEYTFESDSNAEPGQGWNVDDVLVNE